ncbi:hypothetical protein EBX31_05885 [bacterium]|nr:hypothetical protein [bacterium]
MTLTASQLLLAYLCLFLGIVFSLWMVGGWKASLSRKRFKETVVCPVCGAKNPREHAWHSLRCRKCGARRPLNSIETERS